LFLSVVGASLGAILRSDSFYLVPLSFVLLSFISLPHDMASSSQQRSVTDEGEKLIFTSDDDSEGFDIDDAVDAAAQLLSDDEDSDGSEGDLALLAKENRLRKAQRPGNSSTVESEQMPATKKLPAFQPSLEM
jgi:hypothetical protein